MNTEQLNSVQKFLQRLNTDPPLDSIDKTPDGKAYTVVISHIETTLDELFFGRWSTQNFRWHAIANEVQGSLDLVVINPVTGESITRTGAASIVIMVDKVPDELKDNPQQKNQWALNPSNKKSNALDLAFPKLKAECLKNAAQSLGKLFGRDLNRRIKDTYKPFKFSQEDTGLKQLPPSTMQKIEKAIADGIEEFEIRQQLDTISELISEEQMNRINELINNRS
jgi:hypothetical protein